MIYSIQNPRYTKASTMIIPLSDGSGTEKYYCPYLKQCNLNLDGLRFAAYNHPDGWLNVLSPDGDMIDANHRPFHPAFGVSSSFNASIYLGTRPTKQQFNEDTGKNETLEYEGIYEKRTFFRHFGRKLNQSDLTNTEIFNEDRLELIKWFLRWQTEGIKAYNGGFRTKEEYQKTLQSPNS